MKKIFVSLVLGLSLVWFGIVSTPHVAADGTSHVMVEVTEKIPGANCEATYQNVPEGQSWPPAPTWLYECNLGTGFGAVMNIIGEMIKYATFLAGLAGVLFIVVNGILYSMSGMDAGMKEEAKKRITKTLLGLIVLLLSGFILNAIAPWIYVR